MLAIFTDSSHQHIWFPLPQTVTFIETSLQMSGLQTTGRSTPRGHSQGSRDWPGQVCWSSWMSFKTKLGWTKCWLITQIFFFLLLFLHAQFSEFSTGSKTAFYRETNLSFVSFHLGNLLHDDIWWDMMLTPWGVTMTHSCQCREHEYMVGCGGPWAAPASRKMVRDTQSFNAIDSTSSSM